MSTCRKIATIIILGSLLGCSASIQSNKSRAFDERIKLFYVLIKVSDNTGNFVPKFSEALEEGLRQKSVRVVFDQNDPLALENQSDLNKRIKESGADGLLIISMVESVTYGNSTMFGRPNASEGTFDMKIYVKGSERPVWRGLLKSKSGGYGNITVAAKKSAETLIDKLIQDGMI